MNNLNLEILSTKIKKYLKLLLSLQYVDIIGNTLLVMKSNKTSGLFSNNNVLIIDDSDGRMRFLENETQNYNLNLIWLSRTVTDVLFKKFIKFEKEKGFGEWSIENYYAPSMLLNRELLVKRYIKLIRPLIKIYKIKLIILPKLNDDWIIDFQKAAKELNLKILVNDRESSISPKRMEVYPPILNEIKHDLNNVDTLCVNNEMHYEFFIKSGISKEKMRLTGSPQSDFWQTERTEKHFAVDKNKINILYLGFGVNAYLNFYFKEINSNWNSLCSDIHNIFTEQLIKNNQNLNIYYKIGSKPARDYWSGYDEFLNQLKINNVNDSLFEIKENFYTPSILDSFDAIISFQSTGLVEAMFSQIPIISFGWGDLYESIKDSLHDFENSGISFANSKKDFTQIIEDLINNKKIHMDRSKFKKTIYDYLYLCDGNSSKRILNEALLLLK